MELCTFFDVQFISLLVPKHVVVLKGAEYKFDRTTYYLHVLLQPVIMVVTTPK